MKPYLDLLRHVLTRGEKRVDRTGVGTISVFGTQTRYDLRKGFPLVTTKHVNFTAVVKELLWFLRGETNTRTLGSKIWDEWASRDGELGPIYGWQWRQWGKRHPSVLFSPASPVAGGTDQIRNVLSDLKTNPDSRRLIVSAWNVQDIPYMALPPCHVMFQFHTSPYNGGRYLDCQLYQRSADLSLGVPFNIASYALLTHMVAKECSMVPRYFVHSIGDAHIYLNHVQGVKRQLRRKVRPLPRLYLTSARVLDTRESDISLGGYTHGPRIKFPVAV